MDIRIGNESQNTMLVPECNFFSSHPSIHSCIAVLLPVFGISGIILNSWIVYILLSGRSNYNNKMLLRSKHIYVLGTAVTNVLWTLFGVMGFWVDLFVIPCTHKAFLLCGFKNIFDVAGRYQVGFAVCLICYDRFRLVTLGSARYDQKAEVRRAKWALSLAGLTSLLLFIVPELSIPLSTGQWFQYDNDPSDKLRCHMSQARSMSWLGNRNFFDVTRNIIMGVQFTFVVFFALLTAYKLLGQRNVTQMADFRKLTRASKIMFGMVGVFMLSWSPFVVAKYLFEINGLVSWTTVMIFTAWLDGAAVLYPFAFALTLPALRQRARRTKSGRLMVKVLTFSATCMKGSSREAPVGAVGYTQRPSVRLTSFVSTISSTVVPMNTEKEDRA